MILSLINFQQVLDSPREPLLPGVLLSDPDPFFYVFPLISVASYHSSPLTSLPLFSIPLPSLLLSPDFQGQRLAETQIPTNEICHLGHQSVFHKLTTRCLHMTKKKQKNYSDEKPTNTLMRTKQKLWPWNSLLTSSLCFCIILCSYSSSSSPAFIRLFQSTGIIMT